MRYVPRVKVMLAALAVIAFAALGFAGTASAKLTGPYERFAQCPFTNLEVTKCVKAVTESGEVILGNKEVPIEKPVVLPGGYVCVPTPKASRNSSLRPTAKRSTEVAQNVPGWPPRPCEL